MTSIHHGCRARMELRPLLLSSAKTRNWQEYNDLNYSIWHLMEINCKREASKAITRRCIIIEVESTLHCYLLYGVVHVKKIHGSQRDGNLMHY